MALKSTLLGLVFLSVSSWAAINPASGTKILWEVPLFTQSVNYSCGAAAMQSALAYFGIQMTESEIMKAVGTTAKEGTEMEPMVELAQKRGLKGTVRSGMTLNDLAAIVQAGNITIASMQAWADPNTKPVNSYANVWDQGHYLVVIGIDKDNVYFEDPSLSEEKRGYIPTAEFMERWHELSIKLGKMYQPAVVIEGTPASFWEPIK